MIVFAIPFRARQTTNNWEECVKNLEATIKSIFAQTCNEFKIILVANEDIMFANKYDNRLEVIVENLQIPTTWVEMARDKFWKLSLAAVKIREILLGTEDPSTGIYVMPVDGDDLLSNQIAEYCKKNPDENGFISKYGFVRYGQSKWLVRYKNLHEFCGSCNIIKMYLEDLPNSLPGNEMSIDQKIAGELNHKYPIRFDHNIVYKKYKEIGKPFSYLPFPSTIYKKDTGDNISSIGARKIKIIENNRIHFGILLQKMNLFKYRYYSKKLKGTFGEGEK